MRFPSLINCRAAIGSMRRATILTSFFSLWAVRVSLWRSITIGISRNGVDHIILQDEYCISYKIVGGGIIHYPVLAVTSQFFAGPFAHPPPVHSFITTSFSRRALGNILFCLATDWRSDGCWREARAMQCNNIMIAKQQFSREENAYRVTTWMFEVSLEERWNSRQRTTQHSVNINHFSPQSETRKKKWMMSVVGIIFHRR